MTKRYSRCEICWDCIVAVANEGVNDWAAYLGAILQSNEEIGRYGEKIPQSVAEKLFPEIAKRFTWRQ